MEWLSRLRFKDSTITDMSGTTWTNNGATFVEGKFGAQAININTGFLTSGKAISLLATDKWTISFWNKMVSTAGYSVILGDSVGTKYSIQNSDTSAGLGMRINNIGYNIYDSTYPVNLNTWKHVAFVNDPTTSTIKLFVDGVQKHSITASGFSLSNMLLGNWGFSNKGTPGYIDDFCIIKGDALWTSNFTPPTDYLLNVYRAYITEDKKLYGKVNNAFSKLLDDYTVAASADIKTAIMSTNNQYADLIDLQTIGKFKAYDYANNSSNVINTLTAIGIDTIILPKGLISTTSIEGIDSATLSKSASGTGSIRILVTTDLNTYKTFDGTSFVTVDHTNINAVKTTGITPDVLASITREKWDTLTTGNTGIGFAYLLTLESETDIALVSDISITVDMKGSWDQLPNYNDALYKYPSNDILRVTINTEGSYKINYKE